MILLNSVTISFNIWYPTMEFWFYYFLFSCSVFPIAVIGMYQVLHKHPMRTPRKHVAPIFLLCFLVPFVSMAALYGIYKRTAK